MPLVHHTTSTSNVKLLNDNTLKRMHYSCTTWNFEAIIFLSVSSNYTPYDVKTTNFQSLRYTYTTYDLKAIMFQPLRHSYATYSLQEIILQPTDYTFITILPQQITKFCKFMLHLHFALILVTVLNLCSAHKVCIDICVYTKSLPNLCSALKFRTYIFLYTKLLPRGTVMSNDNMWSLGVDFI